MDLPAFLLGLLPAVAIGSVCVVAFRHRHDRRRSSPMILNPYTLAIERDADARGHLPFVQPAPETSRPPTIELPTSRPDDEFSIREDPPAGPSSPKK